MAGNHQSQVDETDAISAIYGNDFTLHEDGTFDVRICCDDIKWWAVTISVLLPTSYPEKKAPVFEIHTECLAVNELEEIYSIMDEIWQDNVGSNILYVWIEKVREILFERYERAKLFVESSETDKMRERALTDLMRENEEHAKISVVEKHGDEVDDYESVSDVISGETITLKKSTFQGHAAVVHTLDDVKKVLRKLKQNRKVCQASHNIVAYRLSGVTEKTYIQDYADDGEVNAGGRLLRLLQIMDVVNIVVVVSRWYGGILLGPDRFRLINNCAREVIIGSGCYVEKERKKHKRKR